MVVQSGPLGDDSGGEHIEEDTVVSHMVIYRSVDGKPGFQQTDDLASAVEFVERLRNGEGIESARIYRLEQVNFRFQPYYQVHLEDAAPPQPPSSLVARPSVSTVAAAPPAPPAVHHEAPAAVPAAAAEAGAPASPAGTAAPLDEGVTRSGATPAPEPPDPGNGIRRGLFGR